MICIDDEPLILWFIIFLFVESYCIDIQCTWHLCSIDRRLSVCIKPLQSFKTWKEWIDFFYRWNIDCNTHSPHSCIVWKLCDNSKYKWHDVIGRIDNPKPCHIFVTRNNKVCQSVKISKLKRYYWWRQMKSLQCTTIRKWNWRNHSVLKICLCKRIAQWSVYRCIECNTVPCIYCP